MLTLRDPAMARRIDDLPARELKALLEIVPEDLPEPGAAALRDFLARIGGIENARLAAEMLEAMEASRS